MESVTSKSLEKAKRSASRLNQPLIKRSLNIIKYNLTKIFNYKKKKVYGPYTIFPLILSHAAKIRFHSSPSLQSFTEVRTIDAPKFRPVFV